MQHDTDFLNELVLLRNDPDVAQQIEQHARNGNPHAQYAMGLIDLVYLHIKIVVPGVASSRHQ